MRVLDEKSLLETLKESADDQEVIDALINNEVKDVVTIKVTKVKSPIEGINGGVSFTYSR